MSATNRETGEEGCPDCDRSGGVVTTRNRINGEVTGSICSTCDGSGRAAPSPVLPDEVIEEAEIKLVQVQTGKYGYGQMNWKAASETYRESIRRQVRYVAPVIARAERDRVKARIEAVRTAAPSWPDDDSYEAGLDAALSAIEGENNE